MTNQQFSPGQPRVMEESAEAVRGRDSTRASTMWKIAAVIVTALFVLVLLWVGSRLVWLGSG